MKKSYKSIRPIEEVLNCESDYPPWDIDCKLFSSPSCVYERYMWASDLEWGDNNIVEIHIWMEIEPK